MKSLSAKSSRITKKVVILSRFPHAEAKPAKDGADGEGHIYIKAFTERFGFDILRISQIQTVRQKQSSGECPLGVLYTIVIGSTLEERRGSIKERLYIHIGVGLSTLLVSTNRAMLEPLECGTGDRTGSTFCVYVGLYIC